LGLSNYDDIENNYSTGNLTRTATTGLSTGFGAFMGQQNFPTENRSTFLNNYSSGSVIFIIDPDPTDRGFVASGSAATFNNNFFNTTISNQTTALGATGQTSAQLQNQATFTNWDFVGESANGTDDIWVINASVNNGFPYLYWEDLDMSACRVSIAGSCYATLKEAFDAINAGTHTGDIFVRINESTTETATALLNASGAGAASYTSVIIHPAKNDVVVSGNLSGYVIDIKNATNATIDGRVMGEGLAPILKVENSGSGCAIHAKYYDVIYTKATPLFYGGAIAIEPTQIAGNYQIASFENLFWISVNPSSWSSNFTQTANILMNTTSEECYASANGWSPIGNMTTKFTGNYNGNGHTISNLFIDRTGDTRVGLFGETEGATITRLGLIVPDVTGNSVVGSLIGLALNNTIVSECFTSGGSVTAISSQAGGLIGRAEGGSTTITNAYTIVAVTANETAAGIVGTNQGPTISNTFVAGLITITSGFRNGIANNSGGTYINNFFDNETTGQTASNTGRTGLPTTKMQQQATYTNWDFQCELANGTDDIWGIDEGNDYPVLTVFGYNQDCSLEWTGAVSAVWENLENWSKSFLPSSLSPVTISETATNDPTIASIASIRSLTIEENAALSVAAGFALQVLEDIENDGEIVLESNLSGEYAQLKFEGAYIGSGQVTKKQFFTGGWHNIGVPFSGNAGMLGEVGTNRHPNAQNLRYWDAGVGNWANVEDNNTALVAGRGYNAFVGNNGVTTAAGIITASGVPHTSVTPALTFNAAPPVWTDFGDGEENGWNLVANPFLAALDFSTIIGRTANVEDAFYLWNPASGSYLSHSSASSTPNRSIAPMQSFWVRATNGASPSLGMLDYANTTVSQAPDFRKTEAITDHILLEIREATQPSNKDVLTIALSFEAVSDGFDNGWDARKMINPGATPSLYSIADGDATSINAINYGPGVGGHKMLPLGVQVAQPASDNFEMVLDETHLNNFYNIYLEDAKLGVFTNLKEKGYAFTYDAASPHRFKLHIGNIPINMQKPTQAVNAWVYGAQVTIRSNDYEGPLRWYVVDLNGRAVQSSDRVGTLGIGEEQRYTLNDLASGMYILQVVTDAGVHHVKFYK
jgi:hypothetical protein